MKSLSELTTRYITTEISIITFKLNSKAKN